jgi:hypothetical protein
MINIEIPVKPYIQKYLRFVYGSEMILSRQKDLVNRMIYYLLRDNQQNDKQYSSFTANYSASYSIRIPDHLLFKRSVRHLTPYCTIELNDTVDELIKKEFYEFMYSQISAGIMRRDAILLFRAKYDFSEEDLAFDTLKKSFYRYELKTNRSTNVTKLALQN